MIRIIKYLIVLPVILFSCQKSGKGYVRGTITNTGTGEPITGLKVSLIETRREAKGQSLSYTDTIASTVTAFDGTYKINYSKAHGWQYTYNVYAIYKFHEGGVGMKELEYKKSVVNFSLY